MYADDIVILAESENELQTYLNVLSTFCDEGKLSINPNKTKCIVFNRGNRLCKCTIYAKGNLIENVKSVKYLGFTIAAKNCNLNGTPENLSVKANRAIFALNNRLKLSRLPPWLALKIFNTQITPILLYGAEIWGPYANYNFTNWESSTTERTHTQFVKRILGCDIHSPNIMVRSEVGKRPLLVNIISRSALYIKHAALNIGTLANIALDNEFSLFDDSNIFCVTRNFSPYYNSNTNYQIPEGKIKLEKVVTELYDGI